MDKLRSRIQLLSLFSIFFIYKAIDAAFSEKTDKVIVWSLITVFYIISLVILYFVMKYWQKKDKI